MASHLRIDLLPLTGFHFNTAIMDNHLSTTHTYLSALSGTIEIHSPYPLFNQTMFSVFREGSDRPIHYEVGTLIPRSSPPMMLYWVYNLTLVPTFWSTLSNDTGQFYIQILLGYYTHSTCRSYEIQNSTRDCPTSVISNNYVTILP